MKTIILLLFPTILFAETTGHIEIGKDILNNNTYTEMQIGYNFYLNDIVLYPYGNSMTWFTIYNYSGQPYRDIYTIGIDTKYKDIIFNLSHFCSHKVNSTYENNHRYNDVPLGGRMTKISFRYNF